MTPELKQQILFFLDLLLDSIVETKEILFQHEGENWRIIINSSKDELLIGESGQTLSALQHLLRVLVHKILPEDRTHFVIDIGNFRKRREEIITSKIPTVAIEAVLEKGQTVVISGLSGYERMIIHKTLNEVRGLQTQSVGSSENRKLLILPTSEVGSVGMDQAVILNINQL